MYWVIASISHNYNGLVTHEAGICDRSFGARWFELIEIRRCLKMIYGDGCMDVKNFPQLAWCAKKAVVEARWLRWAKTRNKMASVTHELNQRRVDAVIQENWTINQRNIVLKLDISQERLWHITKMLNYQKKKKKALCQIGLTTVDKWHKVTVLNCVSSPADHFSDIFMGWRPPMLKVH